MTKLTMVYYNNGSVNSSGRNYVEVDHQTQEFTQGNTATHSGFYTNHIKVDIKTEKAKRRLCEELALMGYKYYPNERDFSERGL